MLNITNFDSSEDEVESGEFKLELGVGFFALLTVRNYLVIWNHATTLQLRDMATFQIIYEHSFT